MLRMPQACDLDLFMRNVPNDPIYWEMTSSEDSSRRNPHSNSLEHQRVRIKPFEDISIERAYEKNLWFPFIPDPNRYPPKALHLQALFLPDVLIANPAFPCKETHHRHLTVPSTSRRSSPRARPWSAKIPFTTLWSVESKNFGTVEQSPRLSRSVDLQLPQSCHQLFPTQVTIRQDSLRPKRLHYDSYDRKSLRLQRLRTIMYIAWASDDQDSVLVLSMRGSSVWLRWCRPWTICTLE